MKEALSEQSNLILERLFIKNIPLTEEIQRILNESFEARIIETALAAADLESSFSLELCKYLAGNAKLFSLSLYAIEELHQAAIPFSAVIGSFLIKVNRAHAEALISKSLELAQRGTPLTQETLHKLITEENSSLSFQTAGLALVYLKRAEIPLTEETFEALEVSHLLDALGIIVIFAKNGILTQKSFSAILAGKGSRIRPILEKLKENPTINEKTWNQLLSEIEEMEWKPCAEAAIVFGQRNRTLQQNEESTRLPPEIIGKIAGYLSPSGMVCYAHRAEDVAGMEETRELNK